MNRLSSFLRQRPRLVDTIFVLIVLALVAWLLVPSLGHDSAYFDEGYSSFLARLSPGQIAHYTALDVHPPLYYVILSWWQGIVGIHVFWLRLPSIIFALGAMVFGYLSLRHSFGRRSGAVGLIALAVTPVFLRYSEAMRMYSLALLLVFAATYVLVRIVQGEHTRRTRYFWVLYAVLVAAGMWTNYFTAFAWLAHALWLLSGRSLRRAYGRRWLLALVGSVVLYLPWLPSLVTRFTSIQSGGFWIPPLSLSTLASTFSLDSVYKSASNATGWLALLAVIYLVVALLVVIRAHHQADLIVRQRLRLFLLLALVPVLGLVVLSLPPLRPAYVLRYVLTGLVATSLLLGASVTMLRFRDYPKLKRVLVGAFLLIVLLVGVHDFQLAGNRNLDTGAKSSIAEVFAAIDRSDRSSTPVIVPSGYTYYAAALYGTAQHPVFYDQSLIAKDDGTLRPLLDDAAGTGIPDMPAYLKDHDRVWIVSEGTTRPQAPAGYHRVREIRIGTDSTDYGVLFARD